MSTTVDERIVSMEFDDSRFSSRIKNAMGMLTDLDNQVDGFAGSVRNSFLSLEDGLSRLDLVFAGFYQQIGGYLADLSVKGLNFAKSLSVDQVTAGFDKYTSETLAVQTIYSNTEETLDHIYDVLGDILEYTDKTSYHYDAMSNTIAKFANQGVDLEEAAQAVKGIANWAALSGAGIDKADIAMNALIRSMASGNMQLREWRTISQTANMGTIQFKETLLETAKAMAAEGKAAAEWLDIGIEQFETEDVFGTNHLITSDVLLETLKKYGDETTKLGKDALGAASEAKTFAEALGAVKDAVSTNYGKAFRNIFGNYEEAKTVWTGVQDALLEVFTMGAEYSDKVLSIWHDADVYGYKDAIDAVADAWSHLKQIVEPIGEAFHNVFGFTDENKTVEFLKNVTAKFREWAGFKFNFSTDANDLLASYSGLYQLRTGQPINDMNTFIAALAEAREKAEQNAIIISGIKNAFESLFTTVKNGVSILVQFKNGFMEAFSGASTMVGPFFKLAENLSYFISQVSSAVKETNFFYRVISSISKIINSVLSPAFTFIGKLLGNVSDKFKSAGDDTTKLRNALDAVATIFEKISNFLAEHAIGPAIDVISTAFGTLCEKLAPLKNLLKDAGGAVTNFLEGFRKTNPKEMEETNSGIAIFGKTIGEIFGVVGEVLGKLFNTLKGLFEGKSLEDIFKTIYWFFNAVVSLQLVSFVKNLKWISEQLESFSNMLGGTHYISTFIQIGLALTLFATAMSKISDLPTDRLGVVFSAITVMLGEIVGATYALAKMKIDEDAAKAMKKTSTAMIEMAAAVVVLALGVKMIAGLDSDALMRGLAGITVLVLELAAVAGYLSTDKKERIEKGAAQLIAFAIALDLLVIGVKALGKLGIEELGKGLLSVGVLMLELVAFSKLIDGVKLSVRTGTAIVEIAAAMAVLAVTIKILGMIPFDQLITGIGAFTLIIVTLGAALNLFPKNMPVIGLGLDLVAVGLLGIAATIKILGSMPYEDMEQGMSGLIISLIAMSAVLQIMRNTLTGAAAMLVMSAALVPFAVALKLLSTIPLFEIATSLIAVAAAFLGFAGLTFLLAPIIVQMGLLAVVALTFGTALLSIATALMIIDALGLGVLGLLAGLVTSFIDTIPALAAAIAQGILSFAEVITSGVAVIEIAVIAIINAIFNAIIATGGRVFDLGVMLIGRLIDAIVYMVPAIALAAVQIMTTILAGIAEYLPTMIEAGTAIVVEFLLGIGSMAVQIANAGFEMIIMILNGIADAILTHNYELLEAGWNLLRAIFIGFWNALTSLGTRIIEAGKQFVRWIADGLNIDLDKIKDWVFSIPEKIKEWFREKIAQIKSIGSNIIEGIKEGLTGGENGLLSKVSNIGSNLIGKFKNVLGIQSPSRVFRQLGEYTGEGLAQGLELSRSIVGDKATALGTTAMESLDEAIQNGPSFDVFGNDPVIKPILDLSDIRRTAGEIPGIFGNGYSLGLAASAAGSTSGMIGTSPIFNFNVYAAEGQSEEAIADVVMDKINFAFKSRGSVWR